MTILDFVQGLDLSRNPLGNELPFPDNNLPSLKWIKLQDCSLSRVPTALLGIEGLEGLDLAENELASLPKEMKKLSELAVRNARIIS